MRRYNQWITSYIKHKDVSETWEENQMGKLILIKIQIT